MHCTISKRDEDATARIQNHGAPKSKMGKRNATDGMQRTGASICTKTHLEVHSVFGFCHRNRREG